MVAASLKRPRAKPSRATLHAPIACVILAVDPGSDRSGWAIYLDGTLIVYGDVDGRESGEIRDVCATAMRVANDNGRDCVLVIEQALSRKFMGTAQGGSRALWRDQWRKAGGVHKRIHGVHVTTWRTRLFGVRYGVKTAQWRALEAQRAESLGVRDGNTDTNAAVCIGHWATHAQAIFDRLPKTRRRLVA